MAATVNIAPEGFAAAMSTPPVVHETGRDVPNIETRPPEHVLVEQN
jgi:hypothetical protein